MSTRENPQLADLSALADGSLPSSRRQEVEAWIAASPKLSAQYERERWTVERLEAVRATVGAPARLHARIADHTSQPRRSVALRSRLSYGSVLSAAVAAAVALILLVLPSGTPGAPSLSQAAALANRGPELPAPRADPAFPATRLAQGVDDVYFPNWSTTLRWHAVGQRTDRLGGRRAVTVYYQWHGRLIAYTILSAPALTQPRGPATREGNKRLRLISVAGRTVITWRRSGDTCVLSGHGVAARELERLAAWAPAASA